MDWRDGQARTAWLNNALQRYVGDPVDYFLGPTGIPDRINALTQAAQYTDAGDFVEATDASRAVWNDPSLTNALRYATAAGALAIPMVSARMMRDGVDVAGDAARSMGDDAGRFWVDEDGAFRVWHGSPHDFDRFSLDKIGTGEGAQAYGHGLYFAESPDVARTYRDALSPAMLDGRPVDYNSGQDLAASWFTAFKDRNAAADYLQRQIDKPPKSLPNYRSAEEIATMQDAISILRGDGPIGMTEKGGGIYEVAIDAEPADFLDWDAPLSAQPQKVKEFANHRWDQIFGRGPDDTIEGAYIAKAASPQHDIDGRDWLDTGPAADQARRLREAGIPGIRYRDGFSRGAEGGTSNYVLFHDALATILSKNGAPVDTPEARRMRELLDYLNQ